jgi:phosphoribosyl-ATP pyrophosphohydrolase
VGSGEDRTLENDRVPEPTHPLARLMTTIESRRTASPESSYTATLLHAPLAKVAGKVTEEAGELVEAAAETGDGAREHLVHEAADLFYHALVLLAHRNVGLADVETELGRRFGVSGLEEKANREKS